MKTIAAQIANNWKSGLSVSLVSIPLSVSLAIAGGGTPIMGIITAIWAGLFAAIIGGSQFNIVGPTGALSGILAMYAFQHGVGTLPILAILTGIITLVVWALRWDKYIVLIPSAAVHGFTLGVAFIIGLNQFNFAFGLRGLKANEKFIQNVMDSFSNIGSTDFIALGIFIAGLALMFAILKKFPKVPNAIVVAVLGIALGYMTTNGIINIPLDTLATKFGNLQATLFMFPDFTKDMFSVDVLKAAGMIAIIAILETLISAKIADGMTRTRFNQTKEVLGLGLANIFSGIFGGMPATAALARTSLNVKTGAKSNWSGIINAVAVAIISLVFLSGFTYLPLPIVASILVYVAVRMVTAEHFKALFHYDKKAFWLSMFVALITIVEDPIIGILVGSAISLLIYVQKLAVAQADVTVNKNKELIASVRPEELSDVSEEGDLIVYRFAGELTYINSRGHVEALANLPKGKKVILSLKNLFYLDVDGIDAMAEIVDDIKHKQGEFAVVGVQDPVRSLLLKTKWFGDADKMGLVVASREEAMHLLHR